MGWLFSHRDKDRLVQLLLEPAESFTHKRTILEHALTGQELWTVVQLELKVANFINGNAVGDTYTFINCDLLEVQGGLWGSKSIPESAGPYYYGCPLHFLDMAPDGVCPTWREALRNDQPARPA
ncbi:hypothetical protein TMS3_0120540 [Pseudomonas taeanensis MS-3]|uniref:Uncharacterized protein n=1 Tax=Pseudomonas taeanensis MS-3 TaxID=1395571 RepID=A0A0A1YGL1_9PSED|nr:hypothetical protein [Pseudomonas taeanensis]KFX68133.1 hypothetical protein TMS3_0120540 [Pseudomonas taeanensis MS-3]